MTKKEFMQTLKDNLMGLNQTDKREVLLDYEEHFMDGKNQGRTDEEICQSLGNPREIAKEIKSQSQQSAPNNDGMNMAGYIIGLIFLSAACLVLISILISVVTGTIGGVFGAIAVATLFSSSMLKITAISAIVFAISILVLIGFGALKLIPVTIKWFKQILYSLDNKPEKAKAVEYKKVRIHPVIWISVVVICFASIGGIIAGGMGFAREVVTEFDAGDIYAFSTSIREFSGDDDWVYYSRSGEDFEEAIEEFADAMEDFGDEMEELGDDWEDKFDYDGHGFFWWRFIFK